jgi:hypothetical protein
VTVVGNRALLLTVVGNRVLSVQALHLDKVAQLRDEDLEQIASKVPHTLRTLSMQYNGQLEESGVVALIQHQTALQSLNLVGCEHVSDKALTTAAQCCPFLESVFLSFCHKVTDTPLNQITYRARRCFTGRPGVPTRGVFNHDDPTLVLADLVIRNKGKKRKEVPARRSSLRTAAARCLLLPINRCCSLPVLHTASSLT